MRTTVAELDGRCNELEERVSLLRGDTSNEFDKLQQLLHEQSDRLDDLEKLYEALKAQVGDLKAAFEREQRIQDARVNQFAEQREADHNMLLQVRNAGVDLRSSVEAEREYRDNQLTQIQSQLDRLDGAIDGTSEAVKWCLDGNEARLDQLERSIRVYAEPSLRERLSHWWYRLRNRGGG